MVSFNTRRYRIYISITIAFLIFLGNASAASSLSWNTSSDWDSVVSESRVVHESVANTDHSDAGALRKGYSYSDPLYSSSLVGYWPLDEDSGSTAYDVLGNNYEGTTHGGVNQGVSGISGTSSYGFDGSGTYVEYPSFDSNGNELGVNFWLYWNPESEGAQIIQSGGGVGSSPNNGWELKRDTVNHLQLVAWSGGSYQIAEIGNVLSKGKWYYVYLGWIGNEFSLHIYDSSGEISGSPWTGTLSRSSTSTNPLFLMAGESSNYFQGQIDDLRFYNRKLSSSEVQALYNTAIKEGSLTTGWRGFSSGRDPGSLVLENVSADLNGQSIDVFVESDVDGDGVVDETSDPVSLNGSGGPYDVTGLKNDSKRFRLDIRFSTSDVTTTPTLSSVNLTAESSRPVICDFVGSSGACVSNRTHGVSGESFSINSSFRSERNALFKALNGQAVLSVSNSSVFSVAFRVDKDTARA